MKDLLKKIPQQTAVYNDCKAEANDNLSIYVPGCARVSSSGKHVCRNFGFGIAGVLLLVHVLYKLNKGAEIEKHQLKIKESTEKTKMRVDEAKEKSKIRCDEYEEKLKIKYKYKQGNVLANNQKQVGLREWHETFNLKCPLPDYSAIPHIFYTLNTCPVDFRPAMLFHFMTMYGALCFSGVRAKYLDGKFQAPSLQVVIEGEQGSGKSCFNDIFKTIFSRVIASDAQKLKNEDSESIIQVIGIETSMARLLEIMAGNNGVHEYMMETEIDAVTERFKKSDNFSTVILRKAFSNEPIALDNKNTNPNVRGTFPVFLNYTFMGTPNAVDRFFKKESYEDGTASRECFAVIPEIGYAMPEFKKLRKDKLEAMQDQIDEWRKKYCYNTDENGVDVPAKETIIDLSYVNNVLEEWRDRMLASSDSKRRGISGRIACMAFRCAMVMHMLAGCPNAKKRNARQQICRLTIYIANYCMERYLYRSSDDKYQQFMQMKQAAMPTAPKPKRKLTHEEVEHWYSLHGTFDDDGNEIGYGTIAKELGCSKDEVRNAFKRYEKTLN